MKKFVERQLAYFQIEDVSPGQQWKDAITIFLCWFMPSLLFVVWAKKYHPDAKTYQAAIAEAVGPNLWNVFGSLGLFSFGIALILSRFKWPSLVAEKILNNTFTIGSLTLGVLTGQWLILLYNSDMIWWKTGVFGITSGFLLLVVALFNLAIWYLSFLIKHRDNQPSLFTVKLNIANPLFRLSIGFSICLLISVLFFNA